MGKHTDYTRRWLDRRFVERNADGLYFAHQPIYGAGHSACEPGHARRLARTFQLLKSLARIEFETLLDVGGGEGYLATCTRDILGKQAMSCDLSVEACRRAYELFEIDSLALSSYALPFPDDAFDVVLCSEVLEHVEYPIETLAELERVARCAVVLSTEECELDRDSIEEHLFQRCGFPHFERNVFHPDDLRALFGDEIELRSQMVGDGPADSVPLDEMLVWVEAATTPETMVNGGVGVVMVALQPSGRRLATPSVEDRAILAQLGQPLVAATPLTERARANALEGLAQRAVCQRPFEVIGGVADMTTPDDPTAKSTERQLATRWPASRVQTAMHLRAHLDLPLDPERRRWDFSTREGQRSAGGCRTTNSRRLWISMAAGTSSRPARPLG